MGKKQISFVAAGVMSGTSVDGLDIALCRFERVDQWNFEILKTRSLSYSGTGWPERLANAETADGCTLMEIHRDFGRFTGEAVNNFLADSGTKPIPGVDLIASHGHTIFHQPEKGITLQIGDGAEIAAATGITTVSDFRRLDMALGGQGAPLVPIGDKLLFGSYGFCLNLGGFANISFRESGKRVAFDICPVNIVMNRLSRLAGHDFDRGGEIARSGKIIPGLLNNLEGLEFYRQTGPRSLGREWVDEVFMPVIEGVNGSTVDKLRTVCEHIALRIAGITIRSAPPAVGTPATSPGKSSRHGSGSGKDSFATGATSPSPSPSTSPSTSGNDSTLLATGGGAKNSFLMEVIADKISPVQVTIPGEELIDFKEAIVFAFLGVLRLSNKVNCLASVTGARHDNSGGIIHLM